jgi:hypothetical protein
VVCNEPFFHTFPLTKETEVSATNIVAEKVFTISIFERQIALYPAYAKYFTRRSGEGMSAKALADFDNVVDAQELYRTLNMFKLPVFKNYLI